MRGRKSEIGQTRTAPNGYHYTRTARGWKLTHRLVAERSLGRALSQNERVRFRDGDRTNLHDENLEVYKVGSSSIAKRRAHLENKIEELQAQLKELADDA